MAIVETYDARAREQREKRFNQCRLSFRHTMRTQPKGPPGWIPPHTRLWLGAKYVLHKRCVECGTWRHMAIGHTGRLLTYEYVWPDGYRLDPGEGRMSGDEVRLYEAKKFGTTLRSVS